MTQRKDILAAIAVNKRLEGGDALELLDEAADEIERLRLLARRLANAVVTGQRYEGLICQAEDFLRDEQKAGIPRPRSYLAIKYSAPTGTCKCGECQLVPPEMLMTWDAEIQSLNDQIKHLRVTRP